ncbi:prophage tail fiber N-terminal domain-containing protein [Dryocola sp. LX212]
MSLTINLSGRYCSPLAQPLPDVTLEFESLFNSSQTQLKTIVSTTTDQDAAYSIDLVPNSYSVCESYGKKRKWLGNIIIYPDSPDGTLNEFLTAFKPDQAQPGILAEMEEILEETKEVAANAGFNPRGAFSSDIEYQKNDLVQFDGSEYLATADVTGVVPPASPWELFVAAGEKGEKGEQGIQGESGEKGEQGLQGESGPANTLMVGTVTTLEPGEDATAEITGDAPDQTINFGIPKGEDGGSHPFIPETWDAPGSIAMMYYQVSSQTEPRQAGTIFSGGSFTAGCVFKDGPTGDVTLENLGQAASGTWRLQGIVMAGNKGRSMTLAMRIDGAELPARVMLESALIGSRVKNCRYSAPDNSMIDCEVLVGGKWYPFTASANDSTTWGPVIYANAVAGQYGVVEIYAA